MTTALAAPDLRHERVLFAGLAAVYATGLAILFGLGHFGFVYKTLVVPSLFVVAWLAGRFRAFVRDWSVFLGATILMDSCRGVIYSAIRRFELPVYLGYAIDAERALFGDPIPTVVLQRWLFADGQIGTLERLLVTIHASHFIVFLCFALLVWLLRVEAFPRLVWSFIVLMALGMIGYLVVPTVPPWMAAARFQMLPEVVHMTGQVYNVSLPAIARTFDLNPIAAMPSLHAAFPTLLTLLCFRHFGRWGWLMLAYLATVVFTIVYLGEHYLVDVLAGVVFALLGYGAVYGWPRVTPLLDRMGRTAAGPAGSGALFWPVTAAAALLGMSVLLGLASHRVGLGRWYPPEAFIVRELDGRTPMADYFRAVNAQRRRDHQVAQPLLARVLPSIRDSVGRVRANLELAESAFHNGDYATAARTFAKYPRLNPQQSKMLAQARAALEK